MPNYLETQDDYRIRYSGCFAVAHGLDEKYAPIVQLQDTYKTRGGKVYSALVSKFFKSPRNQTRTEDDFIPIENIELRPLMLGAVNLKGSVVQLLSKKPDGSDKYRKLPCQGNTYLFDPFKKEREFLELRSPDSIRNFFVLEAWGKRTFLNPVEALESVMGFHRLAAAFSKEYFFGISHAGDGFFLYKNGKRIARVNDNGEILLKPQVHWLHEQLTEFGFNVRKVAK